MNDNQGLREEQSRSGAFKQRTEELGQLKAAVNTASGETRRAFLMFGAIALYLLITVGSTTDEELLRGGLFSLPFLGIDLPIVGFYVVVPILFLFAHVNLLGEVNALADHADELKSRYSQVEDLPLPFGFCRLFIEPRSSGVPRGLICIIICAAVVVVPPLLLLGVQIRFLPYHSELITWLHRLLLAIDVVVLWSIWPKPQVGAVAPRVRWSLRHAISGSWTLSGPRLLAPPASVAILLFSWLIATLPEGHLERFAVKLPFETNKWGCSLLPWTYLRPVVIDETYLGATREPRGMLCLTYKLLEGAGSYPFMRRNLIVTGKDLVAVRPPPELIKDRVDKELKEVWDDVAQGLDLRGRDLRFADLSNSDLRLADLRGANLQGAKLWYANLSYADLGDIPSANLGNCFAEDPMDEDDQFCLTNLRAADLRNVALWFSRLWKTNLQSADLSFAVLTDAGANHTNLQDTNLEGVDLQRAVIRGANFRCANLKNAKLQGVEMIGATFDNANLHNAHLEAAALQDTTWTSANLTGATFTRPNHTLYSYSARAVAHGYKSADMPPPLAETECLKAH